MATHRPRDPTTRSYDKILTLSMRHIALSILVSCFARAADLKAIQDFAGLAQQSAVLFPAVSAIGYDSCAASERVTQLRVTAFDGNFAFDQKTIDERCAFARQTGTRLDLEYNVISAYVTALGGLAGYDVTHFAGALENISNRIGPLAGASTDQVAAVGGLVSVIGNLVVKGVRTRELRKAIADAQPHIHVLCTTFVGDLAKLEEAHIAIRRQRLASLYAEAAARSPGTSPILLTLDYLRDMETIDRERDGLKAFTVIFAKIDEAHARLASAGGKLFTRDFAKEMTGNLSDLATALAQARKAFRPV